MASKGGSLEKEINDLCDRCKSIPATVFLRNRQGTTGSEYEFGPAEPYQLIEGSNAFNELKLSAAAGCGLCKLFQDALESSSYNLEEEARIQPEQCKDGIRLLRNHSNELSPENLKLAFGSLCDREIHARLFIHTDLSIVRSIEPSLYVVETESDSPANFDLARSWLAECCEDHVDCRDPMDFGLPRRLLDVAVPSKPGIVRLVSALDLPTKGRVDYAALSHCWGSFWPLQTRKDNLRSHVQEIRETGLPQTFQDAVRTTRELGLRYLWIDSLCIVQDDPLDFGAECARMNTIFANALCTISASDARDCRDGLFRSRTIKPIRLIYESDDFEPKFTAVIQPSFPEAWMEGIQGPLQSRAWVLQERHLSPRVIHYTKNSLMWECRTAMASENLPKMQAKSNALGFFLELSPNRFWDGGRPKLMPDNTVTRSRLRGDNIRSLRDRWYRIVQDYSHRLLSQPEDKLPALSGFAAEWKRIKPEDEYFAGLWKSDFFKGLAWFPSFGQQSIRRRLPESHKTWPPPSPFEGIPSWSWAAFDGPVCHYGEDWFSKNYYDDDIYMLQLWQPFPSPTSCPLRLHDVTTKLEQPNPFGRVSKGELTVSSWSMVVTLSESEYSPGYPFPTGYAPKAYRLHPDLKHALEGMVYFDHDPFYLSKTQVRLLQLGVGSSIHEHDIKDSVCGLALLQLQADELTSNQDLYTRIGMFDISAHSFWLLRRKWKTVTII